MRDFLYLWGMKKLKKIKIKIKKPAAKVKLIKKNTWYRRFRAWEIRLDRRLQQHKVISRDIDETHRECSNCGYSFTGRICPQCGQAATWMRYTWRQMILNLLDIWGLGNRPMFRTLHELFTRPGYMVRDYLGGHRQFYFPPFKLLAVSIVLVIFVSWVTGVEYFSIFKSLANDFSGKGDSITGGLGILVSVGIMFIELLSSNLLYEWLFLGVVAVIGVWIVFYRYRKYNFVETYIFLVFVMVQWLLCMIPKMLGTGFCNFVDAHASGSGFAAAGVSLVSIVGDLLSKVYFWAVALLLVMDFRQFYGLKWKTALWRMILAVSTLIGIAIIFGTIFIAFYDRGTMFQVHAILNCVMIPAAFVLANWFIDKNKQIVPPSIITTCKMLMLSVLSMPLLSAMLNHRGFGIVSSAAIVVLYGIIVVTFSLLPAILYKKYQRTWLSFLPLVLLIAFLVLTFCLLKYS